ncbi:MAG TPA: hypothetical protein VKU83_03020 [Puia sp.]|nr:hypothetical protein [Puia sp.]
MRKEIKVATAPLLLPTLLLAAAGLFELQGCLKDRAMETYKIYTPVYVRRDTVLHKIVGNAAAPVSRPGQIYVKGNYIYLNDIDKGIHIFDNTNPSNPVQTGFLLIPGNENIAIRNNILYADMYTDLVSIDISDPRNPRVVGTLQNFFTGRNTGANPGYMLSGWIVRDTTCPVPPGGTGIFLIPHSNYLTYFGAAVPAAAFAANSANSSGNTGIAGSEATMTLVGNYLYAIPEQHSLGVVDISDSSHPALVQSSFAGDDLETIFPLQDKVLLLGSKEGVFVYSISNPAQPTQVSEFTHGTACDPVIADPKFAYVTLRSGTDCGGAANELDVLDAQDIMNTALLKSYPMTSPSGLCEDGSLLFVCDGTVVKVFDNSDPQNLQLLSSLPVTRPNDVIAANHILIVVAASGLYEFDYTDPKNVVQKSFIATTNLNS